MENPFLAISKAPPATAEPEIKSKNPFLELRKRTSATAKTENPFLALEKKSTPSLDIRLPGPDGVKEVVQDTRISAAPEKTIFEKIKSFYPSNLTKENMIDELSKDFGLDRREVAQNFDQLARKKAISTGVATQPTNEEFLSGIMTATIPMSASILGPMNVLKGIAGFMAVKEGSERAALPAAKAVWQALNKEPVKYEVTKFRELFPDVGPTQNIADLAEFVVYGAGAKGVGEVLKIPRVAGELAGLRYRILKAAGVKQPTELAVLSPEQAKELMGESAWKALSPKDRAAFVAEETAKIAESFKTPATEAASKAESAQPAQEAPKSVEVAKPGEPPLETAKKGIEQPILPPQERHGLKEKIMSGEELSKEEKSYLEGLKNENEKFIRQSPEQAAQLSEEDFDKWQRVRFLDKYFRDDDTEGAIELHKALIKRGEIDKAKRIRENIKDLPLEDHETGLRLPNAAENEAANLKKDAIRKQMEETEVKAKAAPKELKTVQDVESLISEGTKRMGGRNKFLASDEYKAVFPQVEKIYKSAKAEHAVAGQKAMTEAGIAEGDRVSTPMQGLAGGEVAKGTIFMKASVPWVKLDSPQMTSKGYKKQVQWHKGWVKEKPSVAKATTDIKQGVVESKGQRKAPSGASASTGSDKLGKFEQTPSQDKTPLKLGEETIKIYKAVNASLNINPTLRQGNVSPYLGLTYHPTENISTVGLNAVSVNAHELAHRVDGTQKLIERTIATTGQGDATRKALTDVYVKFYPGGKKNHPLRKRLTEGYATLVQKYLEQPTFVETEYPALVREFLKPGGRYYTDTTGVLLNGFRSLIDRYQALDPLEKIGARVTEGQSGDVKKTYFSLKDKADTLITNAFFPLEKVGAEAGLAGSIQDPSLWAKMSRDSKAIILTNINSDKGFWTLGQDGNFKQVSKDNLKTMVEKAEKDGVSAKLGWYLVARREVALLDESANLEKIIAEAQADLKLLLETQDPESMEEINSLRGVLKDAGERLAKNKAIFDKDGFTEDEVRQAIELYKKDFESHPAILLHDQFNDENVKLLSHPLVGLLKPDAAAKMLSKEGYASFKRELYDELEGEQVIPATLQVGKTKVSSMLARTGSEKPILNPLYSSIINHSEIVKKSLKQIVYNKLVKIAKSGQFPELFQIEPLKAIPDPKTGVIHYPQEKDSAIIMARENYKRIAIRTDSYLKTAIDDMLSFQNFGLFEQILTLPAKIFTISTTGMFVPFTLVNYVRDQITAVAQTQANYIPIIDSLKMLIKKTQGVDSPESKFIQEYFALGGEKNTLINIFDLSPEDALKVISGEKTGLDRVGSFFEKIGSVLSAPANISETATRLTEYVKLRLEGKSQVAALDQAARITVPFKYKGSSKGFGMIMRSIPYFSSSIQALRQAARSGFGKDAKRWWGVYSAVTAAIVASAYNTIHNSSDEQKNQYRDLSPEELAMNIYWPARGGKGLHKIPINQEMGGMGAIISMAIAEMAGANYKAGDYISAGVSFLPRQLQPAEWQQIIFAWMPQIIKPAVGIATNTRDFPNIRPIEGESQKWKEPKMRFTEGTSGLAKWIGNKTNWSPIMVDFFMQGYIGRGATGWLNPMERMRIRPIQADKYYFEGGRRLQNYYNLKQQNDQQYSSFKGSPDSYTQEEGDVILDKKIQLNEIDHLLKAYRYYKKEGDATEDLRAEIIALIDKL